MQRPPKAGMTVNGGPPVEATRVVALLRHRREGEGRHKAGLYTQGPFIACPVLDTGVSLSNHVEAELPTPGNRW